MSLACVQSKPERSHERGSIIVMTAICMTAFMLMLGLCIDVSRIYMMRTELQNAADAAALSAARELNSGTTGIDARTVGRRLVRRSAYTQLPAPQVRARAGLRARQ